MSEFVGKLQYKKEKCIEVVINIKLKLETFVCKAQSQLINNDLCAKQAASALVVEQPGRCTDVLH